MRVRRCAAVIPRSTRILQAGVQRVKACYPDIISQSSSLYKRPPEAFQPVNPSRMDLKTMWEMTKAIILLIAVSFLPLSFKEGWGPAAVNVAVIAVIVLSAASVSGRWSMSMYRLVPPIGSGTWRSLAQSGIHAPFRPEMSRSSWYGV